MSDIWTGNGNIRLEVECRNAPYNNINCAPCLDPEPIPDRCYRPMTKQEVEGLVAQWNTSISHNTVVSLVHIISYIKQGMIITYNGMRVRVGK